MLTNELPAFYTKTLADLVSYRTTMSIDHNPAHAAGSVEAVDYVASLLTDMGAKIATKEFIFPPDSGIAQKALVATFYPIQHDHSQPASDALAFAGHIDVVPETKPKDGRDQFTLTRHDDKLFGRGTADMKGPLTGVLTALYLNQEAVRDTTRPITFMLSSCEEAGAQGAKILCDLAKSQGITPSEIIITEPSETYIGTGGVGGIAYKLTLNAQQKTAPAKPYDAAIKLTFNNPGEYPFLGSVIKNPAVFFGELVQQWVLKPAQGHTIRPFKQIRGVQIEPCAAEIGAPAGVIAADTSSLTIGLRGTPEKIEQAIRTITQNSQWYAQKYSGFIEKVTVPLKKEHDIELGPVAVAAERLPEAQVKALKPASRLNMVNALLDTASKIARLDLGYKLGRGDPDFKVKPYQTPQVATVYAGGDADHTEALLLGTSRMTTQTDLMKTQLEKTFHALKADFAKRGIALSFEQRAFDRSFTNAPNETMAHYSRMATKTGFSQKPNITSPVTYPSDGNIIAEQFPKADVYFIASAGIRNNAHGPDEHITIPQAQRDIAMYSAILHERALAPHVFALRKPSVAQDRARG